jgi:hypothetical protein
MTPLDPLPDPRLTDDERATWRAASWASFGKASPLRGLQSQLRTGRLYAASLVTASATVRAILAGSPSM